MLNHPFVNEMKAPDLIAAIKAKTGVDGMGLDPGGPNMIDFTKLPK